jgi:UDP-N-acetyl-2-amino-2-deoxyglucuronate dehydrogenase
MRIGIIGTGAISRKNAQAYKNIGFRITACTNTTESRGRQFAADTGAEFVPTVEGVCSHPDVDIVDLCTFPDFRLQAVELCAKYQKHILVQKPMATDLATARAMLDAARLAGIQLGVVSQHRFDDSIQFVKEAIASQRLGRILQADAYVKWYRSAEYYSRPLKGSWSGEGGGALMNQGIHQVDMLLYLVGPVSQVSGYWQLGAVHKIESEDVVNALLRFRNGATGVIQATTAIWPGYPERIEIHGDKGTAIITGDKLSTWDVQNDYGQAAPIVRDVSSGASDPMAISVVPFERQFLDFAEACRTGSEPVASARAGFRALQLVTSIYDSCRSNAPVEIPQEI